MKNPTRKTIIAILIVNWDGEYYLEEILPGHNVVTNDRILDKITLGKITVNND